MNAGLIVTVLRRVLEVPALDSDETEHAIRNLRSRIHVHTSNGAIGRQSNDDAMGNILDPRKESDPRTKFALRGAYLTLFC